MKRQLTTIIILLAVLISIDIVSVVLGTLAPVQGPEAQTELVRI